MQTTDDIVDELWDLVGTDSLNAQKLKILAEDGVKFSHPRLDEELQLAGAGMEIAMDEFRKGLIPQIDHMIATGLRPLAVKFYLADQLRESITEMTTTALKRMSEA